MTAPTLITAHVFRVSQARSVRGVKPGMCVWLGTCNRPKAEHARSRGPGTGYRSQAQR